MYILLAAKTRLCFTDRACFTEYCCVCENKDQPHLKLRGLCAQSHLDDTYIPFNPQNGGNLVYIGLYGTVIEYDQETFAWIAKRQISSKTKTTAIARISAKSLLLGSYKWMIYNDTRDCSINEAYSKILTLSGCDKNQFRNQSQNIAVFNSSSFQLSAK